MKFRCVYVTTENLSIVPFRCGLNVYYTYKYIVVLAAFLWLLESKWYCWGWSIETLIYRRHPVLNYSVISEPKHVAAMLC